MSSIPGMDLIRVLVFCQDQNWGEKICTWLNEYKDYYKAHYVFWDETYALQDTSLSTQSRYIVLAEWPAPVELDRLPGSIQEKMRPLILFSTSLDSHQEKELGLMEHLYEDFIGADELQPRTLHRSLNLAVALHQQKKDQALQELSYEVVFKQSTDNLFVTDKRLNIEQMNHQAEDTFGHHSIRGKTKNLVELVEEPQDLQEILIDLHRKNKVQNRELTVLDHAERRLVVLFSAVFLPSYGFGKSGYLLTLNDITYLREAEKTALQVQQLKGTERLTRLLVHEIRNPLSTISMAASQMEHLSDDAQFYADIIRDNSTHIERMLRELLSYATIRQPSKSQIEAQAPLDLALRNVRDRAKLNDIRLERNLSSEPIQLFGDQLQLSIAFVNILVNSIEALEEDNRQDKRIEITMATASDSVIYSIQDNGPGMTQDTLEHLFDPFYSGKESGIGMGMANTKIILDQHRAGIQTKSAVGEGTAFVVTFPRASEKAK